MNGDHDWFIHVHPSEPSTWPKDAPKRQQYVACAVTHTPLSICASHESWQARLNCLGLLQGSLKCAVGLFLFGFNIHYKWIDNACTIGVGLVIGSRIKSLILWVWGWRFEFWHAILMCGWSHTMCKSGFKYTGSINILVNSSWLKKKRLIMFVCMLDPKKKKKGIVWTT